MFCKKSVLKNIAKFTGKHLFRSPYHNFTSNVSLITTIVDKFDETIQESKVGHGHETLISHSGQFLTTSNKVLYCNGDWNLGSASTQF